MTSSDTATYPRSFPVAGPLDVSVRLGSGDVSVTAAAVTEAVVDLRPGHAGDSRALDLIAASRVELRGDSLVIHVPDQRSRLGFRSTPAILIQVTVPTGSGVNAEVGSADVRIDGTIGALQMQAGSGDLTAQQCADTRVRTGSGDVRLGTATSASVGTGSGDIAIDRAGGLRLQSGSGDIEVTEADGDGQVSTASGDVGLHRVRGAVTAKTASGEISVGQATEGELIVNTASGDVTVGVPAGTVARLDCSSVTGRVHSQLEPGDAPNETERRLILNARAVTGAITIHRVS